MTTSKHMWKVMRPLFLGCLLAFCAKAQATITLNVTSPTAGDLVGNSLHIIVASVTSTYQIQSVTATVAGRLTNLTFDATAGWIGDLSLAGLPRGPQTLSLNATDVFSNSGQTQVSFVHDQPPVLTVFEPSTPSDYVDTVSAFTRPALRLRASATDDDPVGVLIRVIVGDVQFPSALLATATNSMDTVVDLSNWNGSFVPLTFIATDSAAQKTYVAKGAYVIANTNVIEVDRVSGTILDVSESKILFTPEPISSNVLEIKSRVTGLETILVNDPEIHIDVVLSRAALSPHGAIFASSGELYEARDGTLIDLGAYGGNLVVKGNYAIWLTGMAQTTLMLRDLLAGTNVVISTNAVNTGNDVAANGDVVYGSNGKVYRYRNGISTPVASGFYPVTDGVNVGYFTGGSPSYFALFDGTNQTILGPEPANDNRAVTGGWTAFTKPGTGQDQVWTRSPNGVQAQRTFFGFSSYWEALGPGGDLMVYSYPPPRLYFIPNGSSPTDLGPWSFGARPFWIDGNWYATLGAFLVAFVVPSAPAISSFGWNTNGQFSFHIAAGLGQQVVTQDSTDLFHWTSLSTNFVSTTFGIDAAFPPASGSNKKFYRVISIH